jgi:TolB-like protein
MIPSVDTAPTAIGRYVDLVLLGQGGMGAVYRGRDPELGRPVALKLMLHATAAFIERFRREAQAIARLQHSNIVQVYDFGVDSAQNPYFVMELVDGTPLDEILRQRGRISMNDALLWARQAAEGLRAAHRANIIHRDIKPANLIVDRNGVIKLVDFGIARMNDGAPLTQAAALMGTPGYMAPEQAQGKPVDHRADIYALGMTLFELVAGEPAHSAESPLALVMRNLQEPLPDLRTRDLGLSEPFIQLIERMTQKDADARPADFGVVLDEISRIERGAAVPSTLRGRDNHEPKTLPRPVAPAVQAERDGAKWVGIGMSVAAVIIVAGALLFWKPAQKAAPQLAQVEKTAPAPTENRAAAATPPPAGPLRVAVLRFKNIGKDPKLEVLEEGIGETAIDKMRQAGAGVNLLERNDLESDIGEIDRGKDEHFDKASVATLGQLQGVELAIQGGFQQLGKTVRVTARFIRVQDGEIVDSLTVNGQREKLLQLEDEVATGLSHKLLGLNNGQYKRR